MEVKAVVSLSDFYLKYWIHFFSYYPFNQNYPTVVKVKFKSYQGKEQKVENKRKTLIFFIIIFNCKVIKLNLKK